MCTADALKTAGVKLAQRKVLQAALNSAQTEQGLAAHGYQEAQRAKIMRAVVMLRASQELA